MDYGHGLYGRAARLDRGERVSAFHVHARSCERQPVRAQGLSAEPPRAYGSPLSASFNVC